jgi:hypothetical protein
MPNHEGNVTESSDRLPPPQITNFRSHESSDEDSSSTACCFLQNLNLSSLPPSFLGKVVSELPIPNCLDITHNSRHVERDMIRNHYWLRAPNRFSTVTKSVVS